MPMCQWSRVDSVSISLFPERFISRFNILIFLKVMSDVGEPIRRFRTQRPQRSEHTETLGPGGRLGGPS